MRIVIRENYDAVSEWVANYVADKINDFGPTSEHPYILGLPTGSSPVGTYQNFVKMNKSNKLVH